MDAYTHNIFVNRHTLKSYIKIISVLITTLNEHPLRCLNKLLSIKVGSKTGLFYTKPSPYILSLCRTIKLGTKNQ